MIVGAVVITFFVSLQQAIVGSALGIVVGSAIGHRGIQTIKAHILHRNRDGFRMWRRSTGVVVFLILPAIAGMGLGFLYGFYPDIVMTAALAGISAVATWWLLMGWWVWRIERRSGREVLLLVDGFHLSSARRFGIRKA
ncbi:MAG: hypothetical protein EA377_09845 [Phycisphaerales bacterium]|nr:MAG: hypothetical protein EA377_09845 [Phycisphaerales bacterium]